MPPPAGSVDDVFAADAADWLNASDPRAPRTQVPHHMPVVVEFVGPRTPAPRNHTLGGCRRDAASGRSPPPLYAVLSGRLPVLLLTFDHAV
jgi:hypothetical protein